MKKFLLVALIAVVSLMTSCSRNQRFQEGNRELYDTITVYSVDKIVETSGSKERFLEQRPIILLLQTRERIV